MQPVDKNIARHVALALGAGLALAVACTAARADSPAPLAVCTDSSSAATQSQTYYRMRYFDPTSGAHMQMVRGEIVGSQLTETALYDTPYGSVAGGTAADGTVLAMEAPGINGPRAGASSLNLLRYDATGATVLGKVTGLPPFWPGHNDELAAPVNAADVDRSTGDLIVGILRTAGGSMGMLYRVNPGTLAATPIPLTPAIPGSQSGDFAIDPAGRYAYGISYQGIFSSYIWRADLQTGTVTTLRSLSLQPPYGGALWRADGTIAFITNYGGALVINPDGSTVSQPSGGGNSESTDAMRCVPTTVLTKSVVNAAGAAADNAPPGPYPLRLNCTAPAYTQGVAVTLGPGASGSAALLLPEGYQGCAVTEDAATLPAPPAGYGWAQPAVPTLPSPIPVPQGALPALAVTNRLLPQPGTLTINKSVTGGPAGGVTGSFAFAVACAPTGGNVSSATVSLSGASSGSATVAGVAAGDRCTITEQTPPAAPAGYIWGATPAPVAVGPMPAGGSATAAVVNTLTAQAVPGAQTPAPVPVGGWPVVALLGGGMAGAALRRLRGRTRGRRER